jgi:hypothetical protein
MEKQVPVHFQGVDVGTIPAHLKVQVRAGGQAGVAHRPDPLALGHHLAHLNLDGAQVGIKRLQAIAVVQQQVDAVALGGPREAYAPAPRVRTRSQQSRMRCSSSRLSGTCP